MVGLELFYEAFHALDTCRVMDGPIPWTSVEEYCNYMGIVGEQRELMHYHMHALDPIIMEYRKKKNASTSS